MRDVCSGGGRLGRVLGARLGLLGRNPIARARARWRVVGLTTCTECFNRIGQKCGLQAWSLASCLLSNAVVQAIMPPAIYLSRSETWVHNVGLETRRKAAGKRHFLQRSFFDVAVQFFVSCSAAFGPNDFCTAENPMLQCSFCSAAFRKLQRNFRFRWHVAGVGFRGAGFRTCWLSKVDHKPSQHSHWINWAPKIIQVLFSAQKDFHWPQGLNPHDWTRGLASSDSWRGVSLSSAQLNNFGSSHRQETTPKLLISDYKNDFRGVHWIRLRVWIPLQSETARRQ